MHLKYKKQPLLKQKNLKKELRIMLCNFVMIFLIPTKKNMTRNLNEEDKKQFKINSDENNKLELAKLPKWLKSRNDFNERRKLINNIRANTNNVKGSSNYKKLFNNLNRLITDISNNKVNEEKVIKRMKKVYLI